MLQDQDERRRKMANTLILYDGKMSSTERASRVLGCIIGNARLTEITEAPSDISSYDGFCFIFNFYGALTAGKTKAYLFAHKDILASKRLAFVGIGFSDQGFSKYVVGMEASVGSGEITAMFISDDKQTVEAGYQIAKVMRAPIKAMGQQELLAAIGKYVTNHNTLALATASDGYVRCTPLEYIFANEAFYIITEGGFKFRGILQNDKVSAAIFDPYTDMSDITGLQIYGTSELIGRDTDEYRQILAMKNVTPEMLDTLPSALFLVKIKPLKYDFLNSEFKKQGFDSRQSVNTDFRKKTWESGAAFVQEVAEKAKEAEEERKAKLREAEEQAEKEKNALSEAPKEIYSEEETEETPEDENETGEEDIPEEFSEFDFSKAPSAKPEEESGAENKKLKKDGTLDKAVMVEPAEITEEDGGLSGKNDFAEEADSDVKDKDGETDDFSELDENREFDDYKDAADEAGAYTKKERYTEEEPYYKESGDEAAGGVKRSHEAADSDKAEDSADRRHEDDEDSGTAGGEGKDGSEDEEEDDFGKGSGKDNGEKGSEEGNDVNGSEAENAGDSGDEDDDDEEGEEDFDEEDFRKHFLKSKAVKSAAEKKEEKPRKHRFFMSDDDEDDDADEDDGEEDAEYDEIDDEDDEEDDEEDKEGRRKSLKGKQGEGKGGFFKGLGKILGIGSDKEDKEEDDEEEDDEEETEDDEEIEDDKEKIDGEEAEDDDENLDYDYDEKSGSDEEVKPRRGKS